MSNMHAGKLIRVLGAAGLCAALLSCSKSEPQKKQAPSAPPVARAPEEPQAAPPATPAAASAGGTAYERSQDGTTTTVRVDRKDGAIHFALASQTPGGTCDLTIEGDAKEKEGDMESRDDDKGQSHFVAEYVYESADCGVSVSIDMDTRKMAWVSVWDCKAMKEGCELPSGPLSLK